MKCFYVSINTNNTCNPIRLISCMMRQSLRPQDVVANNRKSSGLSQRNKDDTQEGFIVHFLQTKYIYSARYKLQGLNLQTDKLAVIYSKYTMGSKSINLCNKCTYAMESDGASQIDQDVLVYSE